MKKQLIHSFGGIIPMRSMSLALFVNEQLETKNKRSRQKRQISPKSISSEHIQTRSKNGVIKNNLKYL